MKAVVYEGNNEVVLKDVARPVLDNDEVLIEVKYGGICGSDLFVTSGSHPRVKPPIIIGHEFSGKVVEIKTQQTTELSLGDRVAVKPTYSCGTCYACEKGFFHVCKSLGLLGIDTEGGFAEYAKVPLQNIVKVSPHVSYEEIALVEPLAVAVHAVRRSSFKVGDRVVILGGGPIGLLTAAVLRLAGASSIIISEINPFRLKVIDELGFTPVNPLEEDIESRVNQETEGVGADVLYEAAGVPATSELLTRLTRIRGEIVIVGVYKKPAPIDLLTVNFQEQNITGVRVYTMDDVRKAVTLLENKQIDVKPFITHKMKLEKAAKALDMVKNQADAIKVLLHP